jgi:hypothetical protein
MSGLLSSWPDCVVGHDRPQCLRSSCSRCVERDGHGVEVVGEQVPVAVEGQHRRPVAKELCTTFTVAPSLIANDAQV